MLGNFYIYRHIRPDNNEVFYIGKGSTVSKSNAIRHLEKHGRNKWWKAIVAKNNGEFKSEVIFYCHTEDEVNKKEIEFIALYGRKANGGTLCNLTNGADGSLGLIVSQETREKLSKKLSGKNHPNWGKKLSGEICRKKSESMRSSNKNLRGKKLPDKWREKIRQSKIGELNHRYGRRGQETPNARYVLNEVNGIFYESVTEASESVGIKMKTLYNMLSGHRKNKTNLIFA